MYCFARKTHGCLDLDTGIGFDTQIVVKVNAPEPLRRQLGSRRRPGDHIATGTNVDCYQRAGGAHAPKWYQRRITRQVHEPAGEYGIGPNRAGTPRRIPVPAPEEEPAPPEPTQLTLL